MANGQLGFTESVKCVVTIAFFIVIFSTFYCTVLYQLRALFHFLSCVMYVMDNLNSFIESFGNCAFSLKVMFCTDSSRYIIILSFLYLRFGSFETNKPRLYVTRFVTNAIEIREEAGAVFPAESYHSNAPP